MFVFLPRVGAWPVTESNRDQRSAQLRLVAAHPLQGTGRYDLEIPLSHGRSLRRRSIFGTILLGHFPMRPTFRVRRSRHRIRGPRPNPWVRLCGLV